MSNMKYLARIGIAATALSLSMSAYVNAESQTSNLVDIKDLVTHSIGGNSSSGGAGGQRSSGLSSYMQIYGETSAPLGFMNFCSRFPSDCMGGTVQPAVVELDAGSWVALNHVNDVVNETVEAISDQDLYQQPELWNYPTTQGDCEDYVLEKQKRLIALGWPKESLLITVAIDEYGGGHAVLTVKTSIGDLILDNLLPDILPWQQTVYTYVKRQSTSHPALWVSLSSVD
ncbi:MAG: transglutaminase-like cysteine peptidase [Rhizobiales bacterium]|nr:transglutaminase-like cysteine peptidase [Hyphomicrobiales bacterium]NRB13762.1 transglutaminase-like cysteine peptidase [Hyphomicrobiales bacterium]